MKKYFFLGFVIFLYILVIYKIYATNITTPLKVIIFQQNYSIKNINSPLQKKFYKIIYLDKLYFPLSYFLYTPLYGRLNYKKNFFMYIYANFYLKKDTNILFKILSDDGFNFYIDGKKICGYNDKKTFSAIKCNVFLRKGKHKIFIKYFQGEGKLGFIGVYKCCNKYFYIGENSKLLEFK